MSYLHDFNVKDTVHKPNIMNLSLATPEQKIKALAELDGVDFSWIQPSNMPWFLNNQAKKYLTSYDAIIPLIQKQGLWYKVLEHHQTTPPTPLQLADALLIATGKFEL